jgi:transcriptional regulator with XRE-family HTH domain
MKNLKPTIDAIRTWMQSILDDLGMTGTELARHAGLAPSTVLRILNDTGHEFVATHKTLMKISQVTGKELPATIRATLALSDAASGQTATLRSNVRNVPVRRLTKLPSGNTEIFVQAPFTSGMDASVFAFRVPDAGLDPFVRPGSLAFATSDREPAFNDIVLVITHDGRALLRLMKGCEAEHLIFGTSAGEEKIDVTDVIDVAVVLFTSHT